MAFTAEQRQKAIDTRKRNKEQRELVKQNEVAGTATTSIAVEGAPIQEALNVVHDAIVSKSVAVTSQALGWNELPLSEAIDKLSNMKREYDRAASIVLSRQSRVPQILTCWTQSNKQTAGKTTVAQCKGNIPEGKSVFIDNGAKDAEGNISPAHCCSMICYMAYQQRPKDISALSRH